MRDVPVIVAEERVVFDEHSLGFCDDLPGFVAAHEQVAGERLCARGL